MKSKHLSTDIKISEHLKHGELLKRMVHTYLMTKKISLSYYDIRHCYGYKTFANQTSSSPLKNFIENDV